MCVWAVVWNAKKNLSDKFDPSFIENFGSFGKAVTISPVQDAPYFYPIVSLAMLIALLFIIPLGLLVLVQC